MIMIVVSMGFCVIRVFFWIYLVCTEHFDKLYFIDKTFPESGRIVSKWFINTRTISWLYNENILLIRNSFDSSFRLYYLTSHGSPLGIFFNSTEHSQRYSRNLVPNKMVNKVKFNFKSTYFCFCHLEILHLEKCSRKYFWSFLPQFCVLDIVKWLSDYLIFGTDKK